MRPSRLPMRLCAAAALVAALAAQSPKGKPVPVEEIYFLVNDEIITRLDYLDQESTIRKQIERAQASGQGDKAPTLVPVDLISNLILSSLVRQEAMKNGITVSPLDVTNRMKQIAQRNNMRGLEDLQAALAREGIPVGTFADNIRNQIYSEMLIGRITTLTDPSVEDVKAYYEQHKGDEFGVKAMTEKSGRLLKVSQIFFEAEDSLSFSDKYKVKEKGDRILAEIKSGKLSFAEAAMKNSDDLGSRSMGGDLGWVFEQELQGEPNIYQAVLHLAKGDLSALITGARGFYLLTVTERRTDGPCPFEKASVIIKNQLLVKRREETVEKRINEIKARSVVLRRTDRFGAWTFK
ncbi:MAG: peptidylprolyl isomerase [Spirochaetes bacterium]|nr:peptidylprolyl isomerase [Spirochaetota bacterium]